MASSRETRSNCFSVGRISSPINNPDYYLRYNKSFNRMGGQMRYVTADNRGFLLALVRGLER